MTFLDKFPLFWEKSKFWKSECWLLTGALLKPSPDYGSQHWYVKKTISEI